MDVEWDVIKKLQLVVMVDDDDKQKVLYEFFHVTGRKVVP